MNYSVMHCIKYEDAEDELRRHGFTPCEIIGEGCFGVVHKAVDKDGNVRAVKTVKVQRGAEVKKRRRGTQRKLCEIVKDEIAVANALAAQLHQDPAGYYGVVKVYGTIVTRRYYHIVMECLVGSDLKTFMSHRYPNGLPQPLVQSLAWSVLQGLRVLHGLGALHRDMKPDNVFVEHDSTGNVAGFKLIDVGLGRVPSAAAAAGITTATTTTTTITAAAAPEERVFFPSTSTLPGLTSQQQQQQQVEGEEDGERNFLLVAQSCVGSPLFRSPAVELGRAYGAECDIWGMGYILYYGATGRYLTSTDESSLREEKMMVWRNCDKYSFDFPAVYSDDVKALLRATMSTMPQSLPELLEDVWFDTFRM